MGCAWARYMSEDTRNPIFHVWNVDEEGHFIKSCHIQVTSTDIILHQRGELPIFWPLQSLRRYGFDSDLFSFECGKHCATGPGIYAFKCKNAASLFTVIQECLQVFSESDLGLSSLNGPENGSTITYVDSQTSVIHDSRIADAIQDALVECVDSQPSTSAGIKHANILKTKRDIPTSTTDTKHFESSSVLSPKDHFHEAVTVAPRVKANAPFLYQQLFKYRKQTLPRCCVIGTCINASNQHYMNKQALSNTTCGSCRTCSLNMCVVHPSANYTGTTASEERARQADYGNVLDPGGHPRQCVHCCCDFKPSTQMSSCNADDCPLHFNTCVDQVTNYARLDEHLKQASGLKKHKKRPIAQHPVHFPSYTQLYANIPTPTKQWPLPKPKNASSWRSLPHFQTSMSFSGKLSPKRSVSHFYSHMEAGIIDRKPKLFQKDASPENCSDTGSSVRLSLDEKTDHCTFVSPSAPAIHDLPKNTFENSEKRNDINGESNRITFSEPKNCISSHSTDNQKSIIESSGDK